MTTKTDTFTPTSAEAWKKPARHEVTLPSGNCAVLRKPNAYFLAQTGQVPKDVEKAAEVAQSDIKAAELMQRLDAANLVGDYLVAESFIEPRVTLKRVKDAVCVDDLSAEDKAFIVELFELEL